MFFLLFLSLFSFASDTSPEVDDSIIVTDTRRDYQVIQIYVDISTVIAPDGSRGTSVPLNVLISHYSQRPQLLRGKMQYWSNPVRWNGEVNIYDIDNIKYMPTFSQCDYGDAIACGIKNRHWTLKTVVTTGTKMSTIIMKLYDENGRQISHGKKTAWGMIRWKPRWKLTKIKETGPFGGGSKQIFEMWPPEIEELPPLITPFHISQAMYGVYGVDRRSCTTKRCRK